MENTYTGILQKTGLIFTYNIRTRTLMNISSKLTFPVYNELWDFVGSPSKYGHGIWLNNDEGFIVYDRYDIWQLDPEGIKPPINITNGYGRKHNIRLRLLYDDKTLWDFNPVLKKNNSVFICGFDEINKRNGFLRLLYESNNDPEKLILSSELFSFQIIFLLRGCLIFCIRQNMLMYIS